MLSGDPFVTPNVNPYVTEAGGHFGWTVAPGTYRVVVRADGYRAATSRAVTVPPAELALHVALTREGAEPPPAITPTATPTPEPAPEPEATPSAGANAEEESYVPLPPVPATAPPPRAGPQAPRPAGAPAPARARIAASRLDRRGRLQLTLSCPAGEIPCAGRYRLMTIRGRTPLGSLRYALAAGKRGRHVVRLGAAAGAALKASDGRLRAVPLAGAAQTVRVSGGAR